MSERHKKGWKGDPLFDESKIQYYCDTIYRLLGDGKTNAHICAEFGIGKTLFHDWMKRPELMAAAEAGRQKGEAKWAEMGEEMMQDGRSNTGMYVLQMRNRFGWRSKDEDTHVVVNVTDDIERRKLVELAKKSISEVNGGQNY